MCQETGNRDRCISPLWWDSVPHRSQCLCCRNRRKQPQIQDTFVYIMTRMWAQKGGWTSPAICRSDCRSNQACSYLASSTNQILQVDVVPSHFKIQHCWRLINTWSSYTNFQLCISQILSKAQFTKSCQSSFPHRDFCDFIRNEWLMGSLVKVSHLDKLNE